MMLKKDRKSAGLYLKCIGNVNSKTKHMLDSTF